MDFASLMKSHISAAKAPADSEKKYLKRSEVEARRQEAYLREQEELEAQRVERVEKKRKRDGEEDERKTARDEKKRRLAEESRKLRDEGEAEEERARRKRVGLPELPVTSVDGGDGKEGTPGTGAEEDIGDEALRQKLKDLHAPRILFGETHDDRLKRYRRLTRKALAPPPMSTGPIPTTIPLLPEAEMQVPATMPSSTEGQRHLLRQLASYFDLVLRAWRTALARRPHEVAESYTGKAALASHQQAVANLRPLFLKLETHTLPLELLRPIVEIVAAAQAKRYVAAADAYLRLSIGTAAWPIGVTMVGIHERSAREKLHETGRDATAHILADEVTRKMLQGIKRCLSFAQTRWPPEDVGQLMG